MDENFTSATRLHDLGMDEISGVDVPANDGVGGWMVLKSASTDLADFDEFDDTDKAADASTLTTVLEGIRTAHDQLADAIATSESNAPEFANPYKPDQASGKEMKPMQKSFEDLPEDVVEYISELEAGIDVLAEDLVVAQKELAEISKALETVDEEIADDVLKSASDEVRKMVADLEAEREDLLKAVEAERAARLDRDAIEKAARWETLTLKADEFGPALRRVADLDPLLSEQIERALDAANVAVSTSKAFDEFGSSAVSTQSDAWGEIETLAKAKSTDLDLPFAVAVEAVVNERPDLYQRHRSQEG